VAGKAEQAIEIKEPSQRFIRGQNSCDQIYKPVQIVIADMFSPHAGLFPCNFVLLSSSSETMHMFRIGEAAELEAEQLT
jgi:hypothetical protein